MSEVVLPLKRSVAEIENEKRESEEKERLRMKASFARLAYKDMQPQVAAEWKSYMSDYQKQLEEDLCLRCLQGWLPRCEYCRFLKDELDKEKEAKRAEIKKRAQAAEKLLRDKNYNDWLLARQQTYEESAAKRRFMEKRIARSNQDV